MLADADNDARIHQVDALDIAGYQVAVASSQADAGGRTNAYVGRGGDVQADEINATADSDNDANVESFNLGVGVVDVEVAKPASLTTHESLTGIGTIPRARNTFNPQEAVIAASNAVAFDKVAFEAGDEVHYTAGFDGDVDAVAVNGLASGNSYYVSTEKVRGKTWVRFHNTQEDALAGVNARGLSLHETTGGEHEISRTKVIGGEGTVTAGGGINFLANSHNTADLDEIGIRVGTISVDVIKPNVNAGGVTEARIGHDMTLTGDATVEAVSHNEATSLSVTVEVAGADVDVPTRALRTSHQTSAAIASNGDIVANDALTLSADSTNVVGTTDVSVDVAAVQVGVTDLTVDAGGSTTAAIERGAALSGADVNLSASSDNDAEASLVTVGLQAGSVDVVNALARTSHVTETYIGIANGAPGNSSPVAVEAANIDLSAVSDNTADANTTGVQGAALTVGVATPAAENTASTTAHVSGNVAVEAASLTIEALSDNEADSSPTLVGIGGISGQGAAPTTLIDHQVAAFVGRHVDDAPEEDVLTIVDTTGDVTLRSNARMDATSTADGGSGAGISINAMLPTADVTGAVRSYVREDVAMEARRLTVAAGEATEPVDMHAVADAFVVGIGALSGNGARANATSNGQVEAFLGSPVGVDAVTVPGSGIQLRNAADLDAYSDMLSRAKTEGGAGGGVDVSVMLPTAITSGATRAYFGDRTEIVADGVDVKATADRQRATATGEFTNVAIGAGSGADVVADLQATVQAFARNAEVESNTELNFVAESVDALATAKADLGSGGVLTVSAALAHATNEHETTAYIEDSTTQANNTRIEANSKDRASSDAKVVGGGLIRGGGTHAITNLSSTTHAYVGNDAEIASSGLLQVRAIAETAEGDANASSGGGGAVNVGVALADLDVAPNVLANLSGLLNDDDSITTTIEAGDVEVTAELREEQAVGVLSDHFNLSTDVDTTQDRITFLQHGRQTGDVVDGRRRRQSEHPGLRRRGRGGGTARIRSHPAQ